MGYRHPGRSVCYVLGIVRVGVHGRMAVVLKRRVSDGTHERVTYSPSGASNDKTMRTRPGMVWCSSMKCAARCCARL